MGYEMEREEGDETDAGMLDPEEYEEEPDESGPPSLTILAGGHTTPAGYTFLKSLRFTDQEDDSDLMELTNILPNAAIDNPDKQVSIVFERGKVNKTVGQLRVRKLVDHTATIHIFRKDEDGTTTFTVRAAHGI